MTTLKPLHNPMLAWREIEGEVVIISPEESMLHELNQTASFIWKQLDGKRTMEEIARLLAQEFEVPVEQALADTEELVAQLQEKQLLSNRPTMDMRHRA